MDYYSPKKRRVTLALHFGIGILLVMVSAVLSVVYGEAFPNGISVSSANGCIQSLIFLIAIFLVATGDKPGIVMAYILLLLSVAGALRATLTSTGRQSLPGAVNGIVLLVAVTVVARLIFHIKRTARRDSVTGLYNRMGFVELVEDRILDKRPAHVISIRIRNFHSINDDLGIEYGDKVLALVGERIREAVGKDVPVGRLDGTNFVILLPGFKLSSEVAAKAIAAINQRIEVQKNDTQMNCYLTAYAGIASYPDNASNTGELMRYADIAMRHCVNEQKGQIVVFNENLDQEFLRRGYIENVINESLEHDYFYLVYQPQYTTEGKSLRGFETLIRLILPDNTVINPGEFIAIAERSDLILQIDRYVVRRALEEFARPARNLMQQDQGIILSVNVSAKTMSAVDFVDYVRRILNQTGFPAPSLEIEITEYSLADSGRMAEENIKELRAMGVQIALDDFGTGYTSLAQLMELPVNLLKIDKSLIDRIEENQQSRDLVDSVIYMGHLMGCEVISEGVESQPQLDILGERRCDMIQGYVWGKPMTYREALRLCGISEGQFFAGTQAG